MKSTICFLLVLVTFLQADVIKGSHEKQQELAMGFLDEFNDLFGYDWWATNDNYSDVLSEVIEPGDSSKAHIQPNVLGDTLNTFVSLKAGDKMEEDIQTARAGDQEDRSINSLLEDSNGNTAPSPALVHIDYLSLTSILNTAEELFDDLVETDDVTNAASANTIPKLDDTTVYQTPAGQVGSWKNKTP